jgi:epoxide hydrolase-like predicted phosphatase
VSAPHGAPTDGAPRGLLIDFGGVLTNPLRPLLRAFCRAKKLHDEAIEVAMMAGSPLKAELDAYERGEIDDDEFIPRFAAYLGVTVEDMADLWIDLKLDERMFGAVAHIRRQGVRTCLLSNSWGLEVYPRKLLADVFDGIVISGEVGMRKPDLEIFRHAAAVIDVEPARCVFVDDSPSNLSAAQAVGIAVIHHRNAATTLRGLERLFLLDLSTCS